MRYKGSNIRMMMQL